jgi:gliding motility-associated-like protein
MRNVCNPKRIDLWLSEAVLCNSIATNGSDIIITGPTGVVVQSAAAIQCSQGSTSRIRINLAQRIMTVGTYTITLVQGSDGNTFQDDCGNQPLAGTSITFEVEFIGPDINVNNIVGTDCGENEGSAHAVVNDGTAPFQYFWNSSPTQTTVNATNLEAGDYVLTVTDANGCIDTQPFDVPNFVPINAVVSLLDSVSCNGAVDGRARVTAIGGGLGAYNIEWDVNPPQTGATAINLDAGNVVVEISDNNGCSWTLAINIPQPPAINTQISKLLPGCATANGEISVLATGGVGVLSYLWDTQPTQTTSTISNLSGGVYSVTVTDQNGCSEVLQIDLPTDFSPEAGTPIRTPDCGQNSGEVTVEVLFGQPPFTYEWSTEPAQTSATATGLSQGFYYVVITDQTGCLQIINVKIDSIPPPVLQLQTTESECGMDNGEAIASTTLGIPPFSYNWTGFPLVSANALTAMPPGTYQVSVTDSIGCIDQQQFVIDESSPVSSFTAGDVCIGQTMQFTSSSTSGATSWLWNFGDGAQSDEENPTHLFTTAGAHEVSLMLSGGCADDSVTTTVSVNTLPEAAFSYMPETPVTGRSVTYTYTGSAVEQYEWNLGNGEISTNSQPSATYETDGQQLVLLTVTDANGCVDTVSVAIDVLVNPVLFFPNAFYPDGINTHWHGQGFGVTEIELVIYTRTGQLVWEGNGFEQCVQIGWDGTYEDKPVPQGVYAYHVKAQFYNGAAWEGIGTVTLIR